MNRITRTVAVATSAIVMLLAVWHKRSATNASDSETFTMGASEPSWSPHGRELAFSMFGSIWRIAASGDEAQQVTASSGYHSNPAWSPNGKQIAFVRGNPPAGRLPNVQGSLSIVDLATGAEKDVTTEAPVAGTLAWSPDGSKILCALRTSDSGALLHEVDVASGVVTRIQELPQLMRNASLWLNTAWNSKREEIYYSAQRGGVLQIWSMKPSGAMTVQLPLTRYTPEDIADIQSIAAIPDGSGVVFSGNLINARGNYEIYRVGLDGADPKPLTTTARDEFSPVVSPDGSRVAFASNQFGNLDLFTMKIGGGDQTHVRIKELRFKAPAVRVRVRTLDESGAPTPVRLYVRASDGKAYAPAGTSIFYYFLEPKGQREGFFLTSGDDTITVPAGTLYLTALKGPEYEIVDSKTEVSSVKSEVTVRMRRWTDWQKKGWQSGENHFHANYNGSYYQRPPQSLRWLQAEGLNAANMIAANSEGAFIHDKEFFTGKVSSVSVPGHVLYWGQEYRNSYPLGHMAFLNIREFVPPSFTSVPGSPSPYDYPLNTTAAMSAREQGGFVTYVHPMGAGRDVFDTMLGAKEMPVTAALGAVDSVDVLPFGGTSYTLWYRFLNSGFHIAPGAGTDVFTNWRGINMIPGGSREYVASGAVMEWDRWVQKYREGRVFVTNGPLLEFQANQQPPGSRVSFPVRSRLPVRLTLRVESRVPVDLVEFLRNGEVIDVQRFSPARTGSIEVAYDAVTDRSSWFAARVSGPLTRGVPDYFGGYPKAHSGPVYFEAGGEPVLEEADVELMIRWIDRLWALLEERRNFGSDQNRSRAREVIERARKHYEVKLAAARKQNRP